MENTELYENEINGIEEIQGIESDGERQGEVRQDVTESVNETEYEIEIETVSDGDSEEVLINYDTQLDNILNELIEQREDIETLQEYIDYRDLNIFEKELEDYTVTESILLLIFFSLLFGMLLKLIGGIITCKV